MRLKGIIRICAIFIICTLSGCVDRKTADPEVKEADFMLVNDPLARITEQEPETWTLQWTASKDYNAPLDLDILLTHYSMKWVKFESADGKSELIWDIAEDRTKTSGKKKRGDHPIAKFRINSDVKAGNKYQFSLTAKGLAVSGVSAELMLQLNKDREDRHGPVKLTMHSGPAMRMNIIARGALQKDGTVRVVIVPVDELGYPSVFAKAVPVKLSEGDKQLWKGRIEETEELYLNVSKDEIVRLTAKVKLNGKDTTIVSNPIWTAKSNELIATFGDMHWHTNLSGDATRPIEVGLKAGRDYINLDFVSPTEHAPEPENWAGYVRACDKFNEPGHFTTLYGWERSSAYGHVNFYFTNADHEMNPDNFPYPREPAKYIDDIPYRDFVAIPHHTNSRGRLRNGKYAFSPYPWGKPRDEYLRLIEIMQVRGNYEREESPEGWRTDGHNHGASAQSALALGHKIGFIASTDNHKGWPSVAVANSRLYAGIWTSSRSRQDIYNGLYNRHTWACWDTKAIVLFEIGKAMQGDEITLEEPQNLCARIKMSVEAPLDVLDIVTANDQKISIDVSNESLDIDTEIDLGMVKEDTFFYLRARQKNGALIYASPIFVSVQTD